MTTTIEPSALTHTTPTTPELLWLDLTRKCQLKCLHCYNASGPDGTHGTMTREDWLSVLDQAAAYGVRTVQLIGGGATRGRVWRVNSPIGDGLCPMRSS